MPATAGDTTLPRMAGALHRRQPRAATGGAWQLRLLGRPELVTADGSRSIALRPKDAALLASSRSPGRSRATRSRRCSGRRRRASRPTPACASACSACAATPAWRWSAAAPRCSLAPGLDPTWPRRSRRIRVDEHAGATSCSATSTSTTFPSSPSGCGAERRKWREQRDAALAAAAAACEQSGAIARGLVYAQRLVESDPLAEHAQRRLMRLHYLRGDRAAAIAAFERFEQRLKDELGAGRRPRRSSCWRRSSAAARTLPARRAVVPASLMRPPRLVGRERELAALDHAWSAPARVPARRRGGHRQEPPAAGVLRRPRRRRRRPRPAGRRRHRLRRAGAAAARLARRARRSRSSRRAPGSWRSSLPELGPPVALAGRGAAAAAAARRRRDAGRRAVGAACRRRGRRRPALRRRREHRVRCRRWSQSEALAALHWGFAQRPAEAGAAGREDARGARGSRPPRDDRAAAARPGAARGADRVARPARARRRAAGAGAPASTPAATRCSRSRP